MVRDASFFSDLLELWLALFPKKIYIYIYIVVCDWYQKLVKYPW